jgi:hypothetical protein
MAAGMYEALRGLNKGLLRLSIVGYLICIGLVVRMNRQPLPEYEEIYERRPVYNGVWYNGPHPDVEFNKRVDRLNLSHRLEVEKQALNILLSRERRTYAYLVGYPVALLLGLWVYAGFIGRKN